LRRGGSGSVTISCPRRVDRVFDDYDEAGEFAQAIDYPTLIGCVAEAARSLADGFVGWTSICWRASLQI